MIFKVVKILIEAGLIVGTSEPIKNAYIGMESGVISVISNEKPPSFDDAELLLGGKNRIVTPGFIGFEIYPSAYPFRFRLFSKKLTLKDLYSILTNNDIYQFSLISAYHLVKTGITTAIINDKNVDTAARAFLEVGIRPILIVNVGCEPFPADWEKELRLISGKWGTNGIALKICDRNELKEVLDVAAQYNILTLLDKNVLVDDTVINQLKSYNKPIRLVALGSNRRDVDLLAKQGVGVVIDPNEEITYKSLSSLKPAISIGLSPSQDIKQGVSSLVLKSIISPQEAFYSLTQWGYSLAGAKGGYIEVNSPTDLLIFSFEEPPSFPIDYNSPYSTALFATYNLETVIIDGEAYVDGGVPLNVGIKDVESAVERLNEIDKRSGKKARTMEEN